VVEELFGVGGAEAAFFGACDGRAEGGEDHDVGGGFGEDVFEAFGCGHGWEKVEGRTCWWSEWVVGREGFHVQYFKGTRKSNR
jgi:hypothetical protein